MKIILWLGTTPVVVKQGEIVKKLNQMIGDACWSNKAWNWTVGLASKCPGKVSGLANKALEI